MLRPFTLLLTSLFLLALPPFASAQVPQLINYQGRVIVDGVNFDGAGQFKFALVNTTGTTTYWSNDGSSTAGSQPTAAVTLTVTKGLYSVLLGDATVANMTIVPATVFTHGDVHLRVWFNDGTHGFEQLAPDKRIAAVGYAMMAADVPDGIITTSKISDGAVTSAKLANSGLTLNTGAGLSGGGAVALGSSLTLTNTGVLSLAGGGGITVDASTGPITLGSNATTSNTPNTLVMRDSSGNFSAGTITAAFFAGSGQDLQSLNASAIASGVLSTDRLPALAVLTTATQELTNKTITGNTNTVSAGLLRTSGADVSTVAALPPEAGQVLTSISPSTANWQTPQVPKFDRQRSLLAAPKNAGSTYTDVVSIVTRDLGEDGCYVISFNASFAECGAYFLLNINGVDVNSTSTQGSSIGWSVAHYEQANTAQINFVANDVPAGTTIKVRAKSNSYPYSADIREAHLTIDGVPQSHVK